MRENNELCTAKVAFGVTIAFCGGPSADSLCGGPHVVDAIRWRRRPLPSETIKICVALYRWECCPQNFCTSVRRRQTFCSCGYSVGLRFYVDILRSMSIRDWIECVQWHSRATLSLVILDTFVPLSLSIGVLTWANKSPSCRTRIHGLRNPIEINVFTLVHNVICSVQEEKCCIQMRTGASWVCTYIAHKIEE